MLIHRISDLKIKMYNVMIVLNVLRVWYFKSFFFCIPIIKFLIHVHTGTFEWNVLLKCLFAFPLLNFINCHVSINRQLGVTFVTNLTI